MGTSSKFDTLNNIGQVFWEGKPPGDAQTVICWTSTRVGGQPAAYAWRVTWKNIGCTAISTLVTFVDISEAVVSNMVEALRKHCRSLNRREGISCYKLGLFSN
jgi:hypothetical protein